MSAIQRFEASELERLLEVLRQDGFRLVGPRVHNQAIIHDEIDSVRDLPQGWTDEQEKGRYRIKKREDQAYFGFNSGPQSWKQFLFVPREKLFSAHRAQENFQVTPEDPNATKTAFIGVRACDLAAIRIQDRIFIGDKEKDGPYQARRENVFIVAVNCIQASDTCFCVSMGTGPRASNGYDLALTEIVNSENHYFLCDAGTDAGERVLSKLNQADASPAEVATGDDVVQRTAASMKRTLNNDGIKELLYETLNHERWEDVARRCLSCANCTIVCPTCFCSNVEDVTDLTGDHAERWRRWDSCFNLAHSSIHGGNIHASVKSRYRQWLTHKLGSWFDQYGMSGCVGCGRCIAWCPVGIDITEEAAALREKSP